MSSARGAEEAEPTDVEARAPGSGHASGSEPRQAVDSSVWALAAVATVATVLSRALAPSLLGVWEGADHVIAAVTLASALTSQLFAVGCAVVVVGLVLGTVKSPLPHHLRAAAVGVGMLVLLALSISSVDVPLPSSSRMVVAGAAAVLVVLSARLSARIYTLRAASLALGAVAVAGFLRVVTVGSATRALEVASSTWGTAARVVGTGAWVFDAGALALAAAILTAHPRREQRLGRPRWGVLAVVCGLPALFVVGVLLSSDPERTGLVVLVANVAHYNRVLPDTFVPEHLTTFVEVLRWTVAAGLLAFTPRSRMMAGALALLILARSTLEVPLSAAAVVVAALAVALHPGPDIERDLPEG